MFMQTTLSGPKVKQNRRAAAPNKKRLLKNLRTAKKKNGGNGSITGGHIPHYGKRKKTDDTSAINLPAITPWKIILTSFLIGICGLFYITHVFSTQQILQEVQQLENEYNKVNRQYAEKRLAYDRMVGPKEIYQRARDQGFINAGPADQIIIMKK
ncbi:MAG: hypothetical protein WD315_02300 [Balneolaceae bacterium]